MHAGHDTFRRAIASHHQLRVNHTRSARSKASNDPLVPGFVKSNCLYISNRRSYECANGLPGCHYAAFNKHDVSQPLSTCGQCFGPKTKTSSRSHLPKLRLSLFLRTYIRGAESLSRDTRAWQLYHSAFTTGRRLSSRASDNQAVWEESQNTGVSADGMDTEEDRWQRIIGQNMVILPKVSVGALAGISRTPRNVTIQEPNQESNQEQNENDGVALYEGSETSAPVPSQNSSSLPTEEKLAESSYMRWKDCAKAKRVGNRAPQTFRKTLVRLSYRKIEPQLLSEASTRYFNKGLHASAQRKSQELEKKLIYEQELRRRPDGNYEWESLFVAFKRRSNQSLMSHNVSVYCVSLTKSRELLRTLEGFCADRVYLAQFGETLIVRLHILKHSTSQTEAPSSRSNLQNAMDDFLSTNKPKLSKLGKHLTWLRHARPSETLGLEATVRRTDEPAYYRCALTSWTKEIFLQVVKDLAYGDHSRWGRRREIVDQRVSTLNYVFNEIAPKHRVASPQALEIAVRYLLAHQQQPAARNLLYGLDDLGADSSLKSFNLLLRDCAQEQNLNAMADKLKIMQRCNIKPDAESWVALLIAARSPFDKQRTVREMRHRGYFDQTDVACKAVPEIISYSLGPYLHAGGSLSTYINMLNQYYSPIWLSRSALHRILSALGQRIRFEDALSLIKDFAVAFGYKPSITDFNILISHCRWQDNVATAVHLINVAMNTYRLAPDAATFHLLFMLAYRQNYFNVARVMWKYACVTGHVSNSMYSRVALSLSRSHAYPGAAWTHSQHRTQCLGCVVCGTRVQKGVTEEGRREFVDSILEVEKALCGAVLPIRSMADCLTEALHKDLHKGFHPAVKSGDVAWLVANSVEVPMRNLGKGEKEDWHARPTAAWTRAVVRGLLRRVAQGSADGEEIGVKRVNAEENGDGHGIDIVEEGSPELRVGTEPQAPGAPKTMN